MTWTREQLDAEWCHAYDTRLGVLCVDGKPTDAQMDIAKDEADRHVAALASNNPP